MSTLLSLLAGAAVAAATTAPCTEVLPSYAAAREAMLSQGLQPRSQTDLDAAALAAMRQALPAGFTTDTAQADSPCALAALLPPDAARLKESLEKAAIEGLLKASGDERAQLWTWMESGSGQDERYGGVGVRVSTGKTGIRIDEAFAGGPAAEAGLGPDDEVVAVDGEPLAGATVATATQLIRGVVGTQVRLTVDHDGRARREVRVTRRVIGAAPQPPTKIMPETLSASVNYRTIDDHVLYLKPEGLDVHDELFALEWGLENTPDAKGLVVDLRGCKGAQIRQLPEFVGRLGGMGPLYTLVDRQHSRHPVAAAAPTPALARLPLAVLIDHDTGPAGEVLAYALRVSRRTALIGEATAGHGAVQSLIPLPNGMRVTLTTHEAVLNNGQPLHPGGLRPDLQAAMKEESRPRWASLVPPAKRDFDDADLPLEGAIEYIRAKQEQDRARR